MQYNENNSHTMFFSLFEKFRNVEVQPEDFVLATSDTTERKKERKKENGSTEEKMRTWTQSSRDQRADTR